MILLLYTVVSRQSKESRDILPTVCTTISLCTPMIGRLPYPFLRVGLKSVRYKMAGQWFALPKLFKASKNEGYEIVRSDDEVIQFKNEQVSPPISSKQPTPLSDNS